MNTKFENIKKNIGELTVFLKEMPKGGDLHNHSLGASYSEFIYEDAIKFNSWYDIKNNMFLTDEEYELSDKNKEIVSIEEFKTFYTDKMLNRFSMRGWDRVSEGATHFFNTFLPTISSKRDENQMILEMVKRNRLQNVKYLEILSEVVPEDVKKQYVDAISGVEDFSMENMQKYCEILDGLDTEENLTKVKEFLDVRENLLKENGEEDFTLAYIAFLTRVSSPLYKFFAESYFFMLYNMKEERIAGVNIVEPEDAIFSRNNFHNHIKIIRFIYDYLSKKHSDLREINLTLHAGELNMLRSPLEDMNDRICSTIFLSQNKEEQNYPYAKRIGHGVSIPWEEDARKLLRYMADKKIPVEICLSSNEYILGVYGENHPFTLYKKYGVPLVICTDDEAVNRSNLTNEYLKAVRNFDLTYDELKDISRNGIEFSFVNGKSLFVGSNYENIIPEFQNITSLEEWEKRVEINSELIKNNLKLKKQIELEMSFLRFEEEYN